NNDFQISTEDILDEEQIISIVLDEQQKFEESDTSDTDVLLPEISVLEGLDGLKKFISFFEQQESCDFNVEDLKVFRKYLPLMKRKHIDSLKQKSITKFFLPVYN
ncbi:11812_t:CDS:1, partial [Cetraspora pellucida]